jgi:hypothetical protein
MSPMLLRWVGMTLAVINILLLLLVRIWLMGWRRVVLTRRRRRIAAAPLTGPGRVLWGIPRWGVVSPRRAWRSWP